MKIADIPAKFPIPFGNSAGGGYIRSIPTGSQIGVHDGWASLTDGFPPLNFSPVSSGGVPPFGQDMNGILKLITQWSQWQNAGGVVPYDATFQSAIGGYPKGSQVSSALDPTVIYQSSVDDNATNPDTGGANWRLLVRIRLLADTTFYVSSLGNDTTGNGTSGSPWLTWAHALAVIGQNYDANGHQITITTTASGQTFAGGASVAGLFIGQQQGQPLVLNLNSSTINGGVFANFGANVLVTSGLIQNSGSNNAIYAGGGSFLGVGGGVTLGTAGSGFAVALANLGGQIQFENSFTYSGSTSTLALLSAQCGGQITASPGITATGGGTNTYTNGFAYATQNGVLSVSGVTFAGVSATGPRYLANLNGVVYTNGGGAGYFPGTTSGSTASGGQYA